MNSTPPVRKIFRYFCNRACYCKRVCQRSCLVKALKNSELFILEAADSFFSYRQLIRSLLHIVARALSVVNVVKAFGARHDRILLLKP